MSPHNGRISAPAAAVVTVSGGRLVIGDITTSGDESDYYLLPCAGRRQCLVPTSVP